MAALPAILQPLAPPMTLNDCLGINTIPIPPADLHPTVDATPRPAIDPTADAVAAGAAAADAAAAEWGAADAAAADAQAPARFSARQKAKRPAKYCKAGTLLCPVRDCGKGFETAYKLTRHIRVHTGARPFTCELCAKAYNQRSTLKTHTGIHARALFYSGLTRAHHLSGWYVNGFTLADLGYPYPEAYLRAIRETMNF